MSSRTRLPRSISGRRGQKSTRERQSPAPARSQPAGREGRRGLQGAGAASSRPATHFAARPRERAPRARLRLPLAHLRSTRTPTPAAAVHRAPRTHPSAGPLGGGTQAVAPPPAGGARLPAAATAGPLRPSRPARGPRPLSGAGRARGLLGPARCCGCCFALRPPAPHEPSAAPGSPRLSGRPLSRGARRPPQTPPAGGVQPGRAASSVGGQPRGGRGATPGGHYLMARPRRGRGGPPDPGVPGDGVERGGS